MISNQQATTPFQSASLYVGDLLPEVTETILYDLFSRVGPVASTRVCRDSVTRRSLGYAYVNFHNVSDAERAMDTMNFSEIKGQPCRIMWSQRDPSLRKSGVGNIFVRNLAPSVDNKGLYDTFSVFGNILSCKVVTDEEGKSKGYGYVHFETAEAAQDAIQKFDGTLIDDVEVHVGSFVLRQDRAGETDWTNLYVKQFPVSWDDEKLKTTFEAFGTVSSAFVSRDEEGKCKGFGFVNFAEHESAVKAIAELHNKSFDDPNVEGGSFELYVSRAQKKSDRIREIKTRLDALNQERISKYQGMNLYVKNISDTVDDELFRELFSPYGTITSARIMRDNNDVSKGFGFVCYSSPEEATKAVSELNGKVIGGKPLVVTLHQRKEQRRAQLAAAYSPANMRFPQGMAPGGMPMAPFMGMYMPQGQPGGFPGQTPPRGVMAYPFPNAANNPMAAVAPSAGGRGAVNPRNMVAYGARPGTAGGFYPGTVPGFIPQGAQAMGGPANAQGQPANQFKGGRGGPQAGFPMNAGTVPGAGPNNMAPRGRVPVGAVQGMPMMGVPAGAMGRGPVIPGNAPRPMYPPNQMQQMTQQMRNLKFSNQARNQNGAQMPMPVPPQMQQGSQGQPNNVGKGNLSDEVLAQADPLTQKNMIGEYLYPLIYKHQPQQAGKITGMLLEMDNGELLNLIESPEALMSKIEEALNVLRNHKGSED